MPGRRRSVPTQMVIVWCISAGLVTWVTVTRQSHTQHTHVSPRRVPVTGWSPGDTLSRHPALRPPKTAPAPPPPVPSPDPVVRGAWCVESVWTDWRVERDERASVKRQARSEDHTRHTCATLSTHARTHTALTAHRSQVTRSCENPNKQTEQKKPIYLPRTPAKAPHIR